MNNTVVDYWNQYFVNENLCSLCGNSGIIHTEAARTAAGVFVGRQNYCICPTGQEERERAERAEKRRGLKVGSREFEELQVMFEKNVHAFAAHGHQYDREERTLGVPQIVFYQDGYINDLFESYLHGYQLGKLIERSHADASD